MLIIISQGQIIISSLNIFTVRDHVLLIFRSEEEILKFTLKFKRDAQPFLLEIYHSVLLDNSLKKLFMILGKLWSVIYHWMSEINQRVSV